MKEWYELNREECIALLKTTSVECRPGETLEELQETVRVSLEDGTLPPAGLPGKDAGPNKPGQVSA